MVPSSESEGKSETPFDLSPFVATLTSVVVPAVRSRTNTSGLESASAGSRLVAFESNATLLPSAEIVDPPRPESEFALVSLLETLASVVVPVLRSRT